MLENNRCWIPDARYQTPNRTYVIAFIVSIGLLVLPIITRAQATSELPQVIVKLSIADFFSPFQPSVHIGLEHSLKGRWSWHHQAGYLFRNPFETDYPDQTGFACGAACGFIKRNQLT